MSNFKGIHLNLDEITSLTRTLFEFKAWNNLSKFLSLNRFKQDSNPK
jgi:hypothetical protein